MAEKANKSKASKGSTKKASKLHIPVEFEEAVAAFLNTPPPPKPTKTKSKTMNRATKKR